MCWMISKRLIEKKFRNRILRGTLLNQSFIAGIGNYLRSEILFFSRLNHLKKPSDLVSIGQKLKVKITKIDE